MYDKDFSVLFHSEVYVEITLIRKGVKKNSSFPWIIIKGQWGNHITFKNNHSKTSVFPFGKSLLSLWKTWNII